MKYLPKLPIWQWVILGLIAAYLVDWFIQRPDSQTRTLNAAIAAEASDSLKQYPYPFHVLRVEEGVAIMGSPRSHEVPVVRFIAAIEPDINVMDNNDPAFIAAQKALAHAQSEAGQIVSQQPGVKSIRWEIDRHWLTAHGIEVPAP